MDATAKRARRPSSLMRRMTWAFLLLGGLLALSAGLAWWQVSGERGSARTIDLAGRRRTLSREIGLLALAALTTSDPRVSAELSAAATSLDEVNAALRTHDMGPPAMAALEASEPAWRSLRAHALEALAPMPAEADAGARAASLLRREQVRRESAALLAHDQTLVDALTAETEARVERVLLTFSLSGTSGCVLVVLVAAVTRRALRSLQTLQRAAERVASGDLEVSLSIEGSDEVGQLAGSFDAMLAALREARHRLSTLHTSELRRREVHFQTLVEAIPHSLVQLDEDDICAWMNQVGEELFGADAVGRRGEELTGGRALSGPLMTRASFDTTRRRADGAERHLTWLCQPLLDLSGERRGTLCLAQDVTERKELEASRELLALAVAHAPEAIIVTSGNGTILHVNPAFESITGYTPEEVVGQHSRLLKSGAHDDAFYRVLWETVSSGRVWSGALTNRRKDRSLCEVEASVSPVRNDAGEIDRYVTVQRDVTGQRQAERLVLLGELVAGVGHELNNPVSFLTLNTPALEGIWADLLPHIDALLSERPDLEVGGLPWRDVKSEVPRILAAINDGAGRISGIVKQLREFVRPTFTTLEPFELGDVVRRAVELTRHRWRATDVELVLDLDPALPTLRGVPQKVEQIVANLLLNASSFVPPRGGRIHIQARAVDEHLELVIADNGPGISRANAERIFEPFFTTRAGEGGSGLGLSVSRRLARDLAGALDLTTYAPEGARFRLQLPRQIGDVASF